MANNCFWMMKVVAKDKSAINRMKDILDYNDKEFFLYRVFSAYWSDGTAENTIERVDDSEFYEAELLGDVAWGISSWIHDDENKNIIHEKTGSHYTNLSIICRTLHIGIEIYAEEDGVGFQSHCRVNANGEIEYDECEEWFPGYDYFDEEGKPCDSEDFVDLERNEEKDEGGIDGYGDWSYAEEIYGE